MAPRGADHLDGPQQFASVIRIASFSKGAEKLMRMHLEDDGAGAHDFSTFAPQVARRAGLIETTMG